MRRLIFIIGIVAAAFATATAAIAAPLISTTRLSVDAVGVESNGESHDPDATSDGAFVVFESTATNLVLGDGNGVQDIFMKNGATGGVIRVSVDSFGAESNGPSFDPAISPDGHFVVYSSDATNLVPVDVNAKRDIFMFDTITLTTILISRNTAGAQGNGDSNHPKVSTDPVVAFDSVATNLIPADANGAISDVFARVVNTPSTVLISLDSAGVQGNDASTFPDITGPSNVIAFQSLATNLVPGDFNGVEDVFTHRNTGQTRRVSVNNAGVEGNGASGAPDLAGNGLLVAFHSDATNLGVGDLNGARDVFLRDMAAGTTRGMSKRGAAWGNAASSFPSISETGTSVAFESLANNFRIGDPVGTLDAFVRQTGTAALFMVSIDSGGVQANGASMTVANAENGALQAVVAYESIATNLVPGDMNGVSDIFQFRP